MTDFEWLMNIIKAIGFLAVPVVGYYVKQLNTSIKVMEGDINAIKIGLSNNGINMNNLKERLTSIEVEHKEQLKEWISHTDKYGAGLEWAKRQAEKS